MKRFQLLTTAIFLFCTLLIAGCTGRGVEAQTTPAPEATPTATTTRWADSSKRICLSRWLAAQRSKKNYSVSELPLTTASRRSLPPRGSL